jgi:uncharacterized membrane protein
LAGFCPYCGTSLPDAAAACPKCARSTPQSTGGGAAAMPATAPGAIADNIAGALAYFTFIAAIIVLVVEPYRRNRFVRFHAFQCLAISIILLAVDSTVLVTPVLGALFSTIVSLAAFLLWLLCLLKAYQGIMWKLPVIGDIAEKLAA